MATWGYLRVSTNHQRNASQRLAILEYAKKNRAIIDHCIEVNASTRKAEKIRKLDELKDLQEGDTLITAEMSRLGRSVGQIAILVDDLPSNGVGLIFI